MPTVDQLIVWAVVGLLGGSVAGMMMTWGKEGYGLVRNLRIGACRCACRRIPFSSIRNSPGLDKIAFSFRDVVAAFVGSVIVLLGLWIWQQFKGP